MTVAGALTGALCDCAAVLLLASGPAKLRAPDAVRALLTELNLPGWRRARARVVTRAIGVAELGIGGYVLARGDRLSTFLLALAYLAFATVAARAVSTGVTASCGCFGTASAPVGRLHLAVTLGCLAAAAAGTVAGAGPVSRHFHAGPGAGVATLALIAVLAAALYLLITVLPELHAQLRAGSE